MDCKKNAHTLPVWMQAFSCTLDLLLSTAWREAWGVNHYPEVLWLTCLVGWVVECNILPDFCNYPSSPLYIESLLLRSGDILSSYIGV